MSKIYSIHWMPIIKNWRQMPALILCLKFMLSCNDNSVPLKKNTPAVVVPSPSCDSTFYSLEEAIKHKDCVRELFLKDKQLTAFPKEILAFQNLKFLDISENPIRRLPAELGQLNKMENLIAAFCDLDSLPDCFSNMPNLQALHFSDNNLKTLPNSICTLRSLEQLIVNNTKITAFPECMRNLSSLRLFSIQSSTRKKILSLEKYKELREVLPLTLILY